MGKLNIAELLKDCSKGMELYSPLCGECKLGGVIQGIIHVKTNSNKSIAFYSNGRYIQDGECVLFPSKENRDWSTFQKPFKDGDVVTNIEGEVIIYQGITTPGFCGSFVSLDRYNQLIPRYESYLTDCIRLATEEEKQKLFDAIKANGYKWNPETKTLEKLEKEKFDITTLKPFESRVLVRSSMDGLWKPAVFGFCNGYNENAFYIVGGSCWKQCIPYLNNEHLCGTTNDCDDYYKTWE